MSMPIEAREPDTLMKLVMIGDSGVGKTNLLTRFVMDEFSADSKTTIGVNFTNKTIQWGHNIVKVQVWDTAGQERYRSMASSYYRGISGALIVYDITQPSSFQSVSRWLNEVRVSAGPGIFVMLIGNKLDMEEGRSVRTQEGEALARRTEMLFTETSAKDATNVNECFMTMVSEILTVHSRPDFSRPDDLAGATMRFNASPVVAVFRTKPCC
jgi:Ras-related protein Rab-11A